MIANRSDAQRAADARYESKRRGVAVTLRLSDAQIRWLTARKRPDESQAAALRRLCGVPPGRAD